MTSTALNDGVLNANKIVIGSSTGILVNTAKFAYETYSEPDIGDGVVYDTPVTISYTPLYTTSILLIEACVSCRFIAAYGMRTGLKRDGTMIGNNLNGCLNFHYKNDAVNHHNDFPMHTVVTANSTTATTFTAWIQPYAGIGEYFSGLGDNWIQVWEFQA